MGCGAALPEKVIHDHELIKPENVEYMQPREGDSEQIGTEVVSTSTSVYYESSNTSTLPPQQSNTNEVTLTDNALHQKESNEQKNTHEDHSLYHHHHCSNHESDVLYSEHENVIREHINEYDNDDDVFPVKYGNHVSSEENYNCEQVQLSSCKAMEKKDKNNNKKSNLRRQITEPFARFQKSSLRALKNISNSASRFAKFSRSHNCHNSLHVNNNDDKNDRHDKSKEREENHVCVEDHYISTERNPLLGANRSVLTNEILTSYSETLPCVSWSKEDKVNTSPNMKMHNVDMNFPLHHSNSNDGNSNNNNNNKSVEDSRKSGQDDENVIKRLCEFKQNVLHREENGNEEETLLKNDNVENENHNLNLLHVRKHEIDESESMLSDITLSDLSSSSLFESNEFKSNSSSQLQNVDRSPSSEGPIKNKNSKNEILDSASGEIRTFLHNTAYTRNEDLELQRQQAPLSIEEDLFVYDDIVISKDEARTKHWRVAGRKPALAVDSSLYNWRDGSDGSETFDPFTAFNNNNSNNTRHINSGLSNSNSNSNNDDNHYVGSSNNNKYLSNNSNDSDRNNSLSYNGLMSKRHSSHAVFSFTDFDVCVDEMDLLIENSTNAFLSVFKSELSEDNNTTTNSTQGSVEGPSIGSSMVIKNVNNYDKFAKNINASSPDSSCLSASGASSLSSNSIKNSNSVSNADNRNRESNKLATFMNTSKSKCPSISTSPFDIPMVSAAVNNTNNSSSISLSLSLASNNNMSISTSQHSGPSSLTPNMSTINKNNVNGNNIGGELVSTTTTTTTGKLEESTLSRCSTFTLSVISTLCRDKNSVKLYLNALKAAMPRSNRTLSNFTVETMMGHASRVKCIAVTPSEKDYASCSNEDASVALNNLGVRSEIGIFTGHQDTVISATFSIDGKFLATTSKDKTMILWDVVTNKQLLTFTHNKVVICCAFSPDSKYLVSGCQDRICRLWDTRRGKEWLSYNCHEGIVIAVTFSPDGSMVCSASADKTLRIWSTTTAKTRFVLTGHVGIILSCSYSGDGKYIISNDESYLRIWRSEDGQCVLSLSPASIAMPHHTSSSQSTSFMTSSSSNINTTSTASNNNNNNNNGEGKNSHVRKINGVADGGNNSETRKGKVSTSNNNNGKGNTRLNQLTTNNNINKNIPKLGWTLSVAAPGAFTNYVLVACNNRFVYVIDIRSGTEVASTFCKAPVYCLAAGTSELCACGDSFGNIYILHLK